MKILISPAKKMKECDDHPFCLTEPVFQSDFDHLDHTLAGLSFADLCRFAKASEKTMQPVYERLQQRQQHPGSQPLSPALLAYQGIAFQNMAPDVFTEAQWQYVQDHLRILSGAYGMLKPLDGIVPYRLEMQTRIPFSLYDYWNDRLADQLDPHEEIICLASEEYAKAVRPWRTLTDILFLEEEEDGSRKEKGVYVKIARGTMVRWMAEHQALCAEDLKHFDLLGYRYDPSASSDHRLVFVRRPQDIPTYESRKKRPSSRRARKTA